MASDPEYELLIAWQGGDASAGDRLIRAHFDSLYRFFRTKLERGVEDMVQRTFLGCVEARDRIEPGRSFKAYLLGIARRQLWLQFRKLRRSREVELGSMSVAELVGTPSTLFAKREEERVLLAALRRLPLEHQIAVELYYWESMKVAEIGQVVGAPEGTVKRRLFRARKLLKTYISEEAGDSTVARSAIQGIEQWAKALADHAKIETSD